MASQGDSTQSSGIQKHGQTQQNIISVYSFCSPVFSFSITGMQRQMDPYMSCATTQKMQGPFERMISLRTARVRRDMTLSHPQQAPRPKWQQ